MAAISSGIWLCGSNLLALVLTVVGYLMGSVCSAVIVSKMFELPDPRTEGSKNPGATNVLRLSGKKYAAFLKLFVVYHHQERFAYRINHKESHPLIGWY